MSYDLYITRAEFWAASDEVPITLKEWQDLVEKDRDLRMEPKPGKGFASILAKGEPVSWIMWSQGGYLSSKWPDDVTIKKMLQVARKLKANVQGEDGEPYRSAKAWQKARDGRQFGHRPLPGDGK